MLHFNGTGGATALLPNFGVSLKTWEADQPNFFVVIFIFFFAKLKNISLAQIEEKGTKQIP